MHCSKVEEIQGVQAVVIRQPESVRSCGAFNSAAFRASRPS